ncbi:MAG: hypothetical protein FH749_15580 [Firmicutes bacterium]|nr:hypothetical protein [Bacillota bacterium]
MKDKKRARELDKIRQDQRQQYQSWQPTSSLTPLDQLRQKLAVLEQDVRQQHLDTDAVLQDTFSQVTTGLADSQSTAQLEQMCQALTGLIQEQGLQVSGQQYEQVLSELDKAISKQIQTSTSQVVQSLQQTVTALAQSNAALLDCQNYNQMLQNVYQMQLLLANWESGSESKLN